MNRIEDPVHERPDSSEENFLAIDSFVQDDFGRRIRAVHFMNRQPQNSAIDGREPFEPPVVGVLDDDRVEAVTSFAAPSKSLFAKTRVLSAAFALFQNLTSSLVNPAAHVPLEKHLHRKLAGFVRRDTLFAPRLSSSGRLRMRSTKLA